MTTPPSQEDRQAAARRKRAQARAAKPQAGLSRSQGTAGLGSVRGKKLVADSLSEQRKREAEAKDKDVQRIEEMLKVSRAGWWPLHRLPSFQHALPRHASSH